jgi:hypothetical protein
MVEDPTDQNRSKNIQAFLQERYLGMFERLLEALDGIPGVLGYEVCLSAIQLGDGKG